MLFRKGVEMDKKYIHKDEIDIYNHDRKFCYDSLEEHLEEIMNYFNK